MMKNDKIQTRILTFLIVYIPLLLHGQAGSSSNFELKVKFETNIPINNIQVFYFFDSGNIFDSISFKIDTSDNSVILHGRNSYITLVSFPTLLFVIKQKEGIKKTRIDKYLNFYLISKGPLSSYTGKQIKEIKFSRSNAIIVASIEKQNKDDSNKDLKIEWWDTEMANQCIQVSSETIKINKE